MGFDRSKFKGASISAMQEKRKTAEKASGGSRKNDYHKIESGKNVFRILPPHNAQDTPFQPERIAFLKCEVEGKDADGNPTGKKEIKNKPIFIATIHGKDKKGEPMEKDPVESYIKYVYKKVYDEVQDKDEQKKVLNPITGYMSKEGFKPGLRPSTNYVYYAVDGTGKIGRLKLYPNITQRMEEESLKMQDDDSPEMIDIFSDPDAGVNLEIDYNPNGEKGKKYIVGKTEFKPNKFKDYEEYISSMRVSDATLKELSEMKPLKDLYGRGVYKKSDFNYALDGLQRFDQEHGYDIFANDEFLDELEEIEAMIPETKKEGEEVHNKKIEKQFTPKEEKEEETTSEPEQEEEPEQPKEEEGEQQEAPQADIADRLAKLRQKAKG